MRGLVACKSEGRVEDAGVGEGCLRVVTLGGPQATGNLIGSGGR